MEPRARWQRILETARSAQGVEPYRSFGATEWSIWAAGMLSALSPEEAMAIVTEVLGIPPDSPEAKRTALRSALMRAMVGQEAFEEWSRTSEGRTRSGDSRAPSTKRELPAEPTGHPLPSDPTPVPWDRMSRAVSDLLRTHPALEDARAAGIRVLTSVHQEAIWISTSPRGADGPEIVQRVEGESWWEPLTRTRARQIADQLAEGFARKVRNRL